MKNKNSWKGVRVMIAGREITGMTSIKFAKPLPTIEQLYQQLLEAEQNEDYELCAKIKGKIDKRLIGN